jgi:hypothetical protein
MELIRQSRLSVAPVREEEWKLILEMAKEVDRRRIFLFLLAASCTQLRLEADTGGVGSRAYRHEPGTG